MYIFFLINIYTMTENIVIYRFRIALRIDIMLLEVIIIICLKSFNFLKQLFLFSENWGLILELLGTIYLKLKIYFLFLMYY